jgi:two-component system response regulator FixJ
MEEARVIVIDGDPAVRDSLATLMELNGHEVVTYASGHAFLRDADGSASEPTEYQKNTDCVICAAELPDISGVDLYLAFHAHHPRTRFALLTSRKDSVALTRARELGIENIFSKPLVHRKLVRFVSKCAS